MQRVIVVVVLLLAIVTYIISSSNVMTSRLVDFRSSSPHLVVDHNGYGDLFRMSYLSDFKIPRTRNSQVPLNNCTGIARNIDMYAMGDSYLWSFVADDSLYCGVDRFKVFKINTKDRGTVRLDSLKTNVLLLQCTERNLRPLLHDHLDYLRGFISVGNEDSMHTRNRSLLQDVKGFLFNKDINKNIELNAFSFPIFSSIKAMKADFNLAFFDRVDEQVAISTAGDRLYYYQTIDTTYLESSFKYIADSEIDRMVSELNKLYDQYRKSGFDEVYVAVVPNPVSLYDPNYKGLKYNHLIERLQNHPLLKMPYIDINLVFKSLSMDLYYRSDTHWNMTGAYTWVNEVNKKLREHQAKTESFVSAQSHPAPIPSTFR